MNPSKRMQWAFFLTLSTVLLTLYAQTNGAGASGGRVLGFSTMREAIAALQMPVATIVIFGLGFDELRRGWDNLRRGRLNHHTLALIAIALAYGYSHLLVIDARIVSGNAMIRPHTAQPFPLFDATAILVTGLMWISLTQDRVRAAGQKAIDKLVASVETPEADDLRRMAQSAFFSEIPVLSQQSNRWLTRLTRIALLLTVVTGIGWWNSGTEPIVPTTIAAMVAVLVVAFPAAARLSSTLPVQTTLTETLKTGTVVKSASALASLAQADRFVVQDDSFAQWPAALEKAGMRPVEAGENLTESVAKLTADGHQVVVLGHYSGDPLHPGVVVVAQQVSPETSVFAPDVILLGTPTEPASAETLLALRKLAGKTSGRVRRGLTWTNAYHLVGLLLACGLIAPVIDWTMAPWLAALASVAFARLILPPAKSTTQPQPAQ